MQVKTITTAAGVNEIDFGNDSSQSTAHFYWLKNLGDSTLYASANPNPIAEKDDVAELPAKGAVSVETDEGKIYVLGAGKVEIHRTNSKFCPFDWQSSGSGGGGGSITVDSELSDTSTNPLQNKVTTAAINEVNSILETKSDINHIHDISASGNPVVMDNLQGGVPFSEITVSGKNLLTLNKSTFTKDGITATANDDGSITLNGTATADTYIGMWNNLYARSIGVGKITINAIDGQSSTTYYMGIDRREGSSYINRIAQSIDNNGVGEITQEDVENNRHFYVWIFIAANYTANNLVFRPQIELGDTATAYEPPITGRELTVSVSGKNLIPYPYQTVSKSVGNLNIEINDSGEIIINGSHTSDVWIDICVNKNSGYYIPLFKGKTYKLSGVPKNSETYMQMNINKSDGARDTALFSGTYDSPAYTVPEDGMYALILIKCPANVSYSNFIIKPQLEFGDTATPYEPYNGSVTTITPDSNPYVVPNDIRQVEGLNNISVSAGELSVVGVQKNAAIKRIWDDVKTLLGDISQFLVGRSKGLSDLIELWVGLGELSDPRCYRLIPVLSSNAGPNGAASCNTEVTFGTNETAYQAFDNNIATYLSYIGENVSGGWVMYEFVSPVCISKMSASVGIGLTGNSFDFHFEYYDDVSKMWIIFGDEMNVSGLTGTTFKNFEMISDIVTTTKVRIISNTEKVEKTNWLVSEFQVYGYMLE